MRLVRPLSMPPARSFSWQQAADRLDPVAPRREERKPVTLATVFAGFRYIRHQPIVLGAISLDLFAVLLGGVTALLPIYARDILEAGPWALGLLRSAPAVGALAIAIVLAHHSIAGHAGRIMFVAVGMFGLATLIFGLSTSIVLSFLALVIYGASDAVSVDPSIARSVAHAPRHAGPGHGGQCDVHRLSGTLGEFRAGAVAAWLGAVPAVLMGIGTIVVMLIWMWAFRSYAASAN